MDKLAQDLASLIMKHTPSYKAAAEQLEKQAGILEALGLRGAAAPAAAAPSAGGNVMKTLAPIAALLALAGGAYAFKDKLGFGGGEDEEGKVPGGSKLKRPQRIEPKGDYWRALQQGKRPDRPAPKQEPKFEYKQDPKGSGGVDVPDWLKDIFTNIWPQ